MYVHEHTKVSDTLQHQHQVTNILVISQILKLSTIRSSFSPYWEPKARVQIKWTTTRVLRASEATCITETSSISKLIPVSNDLKNDRDRDCDPFWKWDLYICLRSNSHIKRKFMRFINFTEKNWNKIMFSCFDSHSAPLATKP